MVKKEVKKKKTTSKKKPTSKNKPVKNPPTKKSKIKEEDKKIERILIENFVGLQKVMVNLSVKFEELSNKISKLLEIFEISAKALAEKDLTIEQTARDDSKIIQEIGNLSNQNKVIARGLTLMHEKLSGEPEDSMEKPFQSSFPEEHEYESHYEEEGVRRPFVLVPRKSKTEESNEIPFSENQKYERKHEDRRYPPQKIQEFAHLPFRKPPMQKLPQQTMNSPNQTTPIKDSMEGYQKSIASENQNETPPK